MGVLKHRESQVSSSTLIFSLILGKIKRYEIRVSFQFFEAATPLSPRSYVSF